MGNVIIAFSCWKLTDLLLALRGINRGVIVITLGQMRVCGLSPPSSLPNFELLLPVKRNNIFLMNSIFKYTYYSCIPRMSDLYLHRSYSNIISELWTRVTQSSQACQKHFRGDLKINGTWFGRDWERGCVKGGPEIHVTYAADCKEPKVCTKIRRYADDD